MICRIKCVRGRKEGFGNFGRFRSRLRPGFVKSVLQTSLNFSYVLCIITTALYYVDECFRYSD